MYRGHLDKISNNLLLGAVNSFNGQIGAGRNIFNNKVAPFPDIARTYRNQGIKWLIIGDMNYGEGSSREHAAMSPRYLGCVAVIARTFARIHETNLKKQGVLAATFANPSDYDKVREHDRVSIEGLSQLEPGKPIEYSDEVKTNESHQSHMRQEQVATLYTLISVDRSRLL